MRRENKIKLVKSFRSISPMADNKRNRFPDHCNLSSSVSTSVHNLYLQERPQTDKMSQTLICNPDAADTLWSHDTLK